MLERVTRVLWVFAMVSLVLAVFVQSDRLRRHRAASAEMAQDFAKLSAEASVIRTQLIDELNRAFTAAPLPSSKLAGSRVVYALVDDGCAASILALERLAFGEFSFDLLLSSVTMPADQRQQWLERFGSRAAWVDFPVDHPMLARIPQGVTPVFIEVSMGEVVDLVIGQPREEWLHAIETGGV